MQAKHVTLPAWTLIISGLLTALAVLPPLRPVLVTFGDWAFWPLDGTPGTLDSVHLLVAAVAGGLMTGWGVFMLALSKDCDLSKALLLGALTWFVVDSSGSAIAGAPMNGVFNLGFLALMLWPVLASRKAQPA
ncbi:MAG: hypothetical protein QUV02_13385 [Maricaulis sp.]|uniref:hypothetical protein n=1 Tax=Maricaulis sp. TaxID=1486257 RepID=UPI00260FEF4B|nr:hypothetical protein [Maricaulis sp.]MDM7985429.1 hypothetical protein [Maricaulis sp.]